MKLRNLSTREILMSVMTLMLFIFGGMITPGNTAQSFPGGVLGDPSIQQVIQYSQKPKPWTGECRSGEISYCHWPIGGCTPSASSAIGWATFRVQQCIDNLKKACDGTFSSTAIDVATVYVNYPLVLGYANIYYASSTVTCS